MNISQLTELLKALDSVTGPAAPDGPSEPAHPWEIGENYLVRTVTQILTGQLVAVYPAELVLVDAAWIADTGRYADAIESASFSEVEPYPTGRRVIVSRGAVIDATTITALPREQK